MEVAIKLPHVHLFSFPFHSYDPKLFINISQSPLPKYNKAKLGEGKGLRKQRGWMSVAYRYSGSRGRYSDDDDDEEEEEEGGGFEEAVELFNRREYYKCHDLLEALWNKAEEPSRTLLHGILQCAVGFHHLFNNNHKGAMMELGEGLCKLRKMNFESGGPFFDFEQDIAAVLDFIYNTQIELAACGDDMCVTMEQSERSYLLLGGYAAGQHLYHLQTDDSNHQIIYIVFRPQKFAQSSPPTPKVRLPFLKAAEAHLLVYQSH